MPLSLIYGAYLFEGAEPMSDRVSFPPERGTLLCVVPGKHERIPDRFPEFALDKIEAPAVFIGRGDWVERMI